MNTYQLLQGDVLERLRGLEDESVHCVVTSPPYWGLRDYGMPGQIGLESTPQAFVAKLVAVFREVRRVLRADGTCWVNLGDSYNAAGREGHGTRTGYKQGTNRASANGSDRCRPSSDVLKPKDLIGIPWRVAFALQDDGWWLRQDIIWSKPNPMPESVTDRCTKAHEYIFLLTKSERYHYDADAVREEATKGAAGSRFDTGKTATHQLDRSSGAERAEDGYRNKRSVWTIATEPNAEAHFATFPTALVEPCILAGCPSGGTVLDPFNGTGTTGLVALRLGRQYIGIELNPEYIAISDRRIHGDNPLFNQNTTEEPIAL